MRYLLLVTIGLIGCDSAPKFNRHKFIEELDSAYSITHSVEIDTLWKRTEQLEADIEDHKKIIQQTESLSKQLKNTNNKTIELQQELRVYKDSVDVIQEILTRPIIDSVNIQHDVMDSIEIN